LLLSTLALSARAAQEDIEPLLRLELDELMHMPVITVSRHEQALWQAPAAVTVLEGRNLRRRGYRSLAEALAWVPGFHVVSDGVGDYAVVRGVGSGQGAYGRTLKLMLDGQPLGIRSDAGQFLGPELLPLGLVERVEIVRGPASALYGADAYLGVINIITRRDETTRLQLGAGGEEGGGPGASAEAVATRRAGRWSATLAATLAREERSGRELPLSSPQYNAFTDTQSRDDFSRPAALYARVTNEGAALRHSLVLHVSERDADAEFLPFVALSHDSRVATRQQTLSWQSEWDSHPGWQSRLRLAHAWGGPTGDERFSQGAGSSARPARDFGYRAWDLALEQQYRRARHYVVGGLDGGWDREEPFEVFSVDQASGASVLISPVQPERLFRNLGAYLQYQWQPLPARDWTLSLNWRHDSHNRYGGHDSYRLGLTGHLLPALSGKLLYGTAFKAPNAFQLYGQPLFLRDMLGNPGLQPETVRTVEGQLAWQVRADLLWTVTAYRLQVERLIELQPFGSNQRWSNRGRQRGHGLESEWRWRGEAMDAGLTTAWHDTVVQLEEPLIPLAEVQTASAPRLVAMLDWSYRQQAREFGAAARYVAERRASDSNIDSNLREVYTLPSYGVLRLHGLQQWGAHRLGLVLDNALDERYAEPGYGGVDLPAPRRRLWLTWSWQR
jgi:iron complex outermembrane receptor protein